MSRLLQILQEQSDDLDRFISFIQNNHPHYGTVPRFFLECQAFQNDTDNRRRAKIGRKIYRDYVCGSSFLPVELLRKLDLAFQTDPKSCDANVFFDVITTLWNIMERYLYPSYLKCQERFELEDTIRTFHDSKSSSNQSSDHSRTPSDGESRKPVQQPPVVASKAESLLRNFPETGANNQLRPTLSCYSGQPIPFPQRTTIEGSSQIGYLKKPESSDTNAYQKPKQTFEPHVMDWNEMERRAKQNKSDGLSIPSSIKPTSLASTTEQLRLWDQSQISSLERKISAIDITRNNGMDDSERVLVEKSEEIWQKRSPDQYKSFGPYNPDRPRIENTTHIAPGSSVGSCSTQSVSSNLESGKQAVISLGSLGRLPPMYSSRQQPTGYTTDSGVGLSGRSHVSGTSEGYRGPALSSAKAALERSSRRPSSSAAGVEVLYRIDYKGDFFKPARQLTDLTLGGLRQILPDNVGSSSFKFYFKKPDERLPEGYVFDEVLEPAGRIPLFEGRVIATLLPDRNANFSSCSICKNQLLWTLSLC